MEFNGEMILVVPRDLELFQCHAPLPKCALLSCLCDCLMLVSRLALGEEKRENDPVLWLPRGESVLGLYQVWHTKERVWGLGYYYSQRSSTAQTIRPIIKVNSFISGHLATLVPVNPCVENAWNFLSKWPR